MQNIQLFIAGKWVDGESSYTYNDTYTGNPVATVQVPDRGQTDKALESLKKAVSEISMTGYERFRVLSRASELVAERRADLVEAIVRDTGFTRADADREAVRAVETLRISGEEAARLTGRTVPFDGAPGGAGRLAFTTRHPLGVICAITPFNSPLSTVCHKVGPALAAGNAVLLKPAGNTPLTATLLVELLLEAGLPEGLIGLLHGSGSTVGQWLLESPIPSFYAFTGSTSVGLHIRREIGIRKAQLELGSLSSTIVCADANLAKAAPLVVNAGFRKAGQVCTSVQRLYVQRPIIEEFSAALTESLSGRVIGDPRAENAFVGPLIDRASATRVSTWIDEALSGGARRVIGGELDGSVLTPTILTDVTRGMKVMDQEIFGPVIVLRPFDDLAEAVTEANDTPYGLSAGLFTSNVDTALWAAEHMEVGTLHVNETSSTRVDLMPFGGVKASGTGLEGPAYAVKEMSVERLITLGASGL